MRILQSVFLLDISDGSGIANILVLIAIIFGVYALVKASSRSIKVVHSHWHHMFETRPFTPLEFYELLEKGIKEKEVDGISFSTITHSERGILSANREYRRVKFRDYMIDICAAPFAKQDFFVSWWLGDSGITFRDFLISIPVFGKLFTRREKTFYEQDTEIMFKETIARCVKDTIEKLTEEKGSRQLNLSDWRGSNLQFKN